jgi:hypothetical protein
MSALTGILRSGAGSVLLHPWRSAALVASVVALLLPFTAGMAIAQGLGDEAAIAARLGPDLLVTGARFGRPCPIPVAAVERIRALPGVERARGRVVGATTLGVARVPAVVVGIEGDAVPDGVSLLDGAWFSPGDSDEFVVGSALARRLGLPPGALIPPFYSNRDGDRVSRVSGVFRSDLPPWEAHLVFTSLITARRVFDERESVTEILVDCVPGYEQAVREGVLRLRTLAPAGVEERIAPRVADAAEREAALAAPLTFGAGVFALHFVLLYAAAVPLLLVASGAGLRERRRETGVLKMLGWGTDAVLLRVFTESVILAAAGASLAVLGAVLWLGPGNAVGLAAVFLPGAEAAPEFIVPWRMAAGPVLSAAALALVLMLAGTLPANARAASAEPLEAMR